MALGLHSDVLQGQYRPNRRVFWHQRIYCAGRGAFGKIGAFRDA